MWKQEFGALLNREFERVKKANHRASLRSFASKLGVAHSTLAAILKGAPWNLSEKLVERVLTKLSVDDRERRRILALMGKTSTPPRRVLPDRSSKILADWLFVPVLLSFDLAEESRAPAAIAKRLGVAPARVKEVIAILHEEGLITKTGDTYVRSNEEWTTTDNVSSESVRNHNRLALQVATRALDEIPVERRDVTTLTFTGHRRHMELVRAEIRQLQDRVQAIMSSADGSDEELFQMTVGLFPLDFSASDSKTTDKRGST